MFFVVANPFGILKLRIKETTKHKEHDKMFKVEKNVAIPATAWAMKAKYPFAKMSVGDSFFVPVEPQTRLSFDRARARICSACYSFCKGGYSDKFTIRKIEHEGGFRVWRIA